MILGVRPFPPGPAHRLLLQESLGMIVQAGDTPLASRLNGPGIAEAAARALHSREPQRWSELAGDGRPLDVMLDACLCDAIEGTRTDSPEPEVPASSLRTGPFRPEVIGPLGPWLEQRTRMLREVDPHALRIVDLRLRGNELREIAQSLGLGLRLTRAILDALGASFQETCRP